MHVRIARKCENPGKHTCMHAFVAHRINAAPITLRRILLALAMSGSSAMMRRWSEVARLAVNKVQLSIGNQLLTPMMCNGISFPGGEVRCAVLLPPPMSSYIGCNLPDITQIMKNSLEITQNYIYFALHQCFGCHHRHGLQARGPMRRPKVTQRANRKKC